MEKETFCTVEYVVSFNLNIITKESRPLKMMMIYKVGKL